MRPVLSTLCLLGMLSLPAHSAQYVYPAQGQSSERQQQDDYECHQWAVKQTGVDPTAQSPATPATPSAGRSTAKGALVGGVIGSLDGNWGKGAAIGAGAGALLGARRQSAASAQQAQAATASLSQYERAKASCLTGRGYTVK